MRGAKCGDLRHSGIEDSNAEAYSTSPVNLKYGKRDGDYLCVILSKQNILGRRRVYVTASAGKTSFTEVV